MAVEAKFYVAEVTMYSQQDQGKVLLRPVSRGAVNSRWASASPSGEYWMNITNPAAFVWFKDRLGQEVRIKITEFIPDPTDHAFIPRADRDDEGVKGVVWGWDLCLECGHAEDEHPSE